MTHFFRCSSIQIHVASVVWSSRSLLLRQWQLSGTYTSTPPPLLPWSLLNWEYPGMLTSPSSTVLSSQVSLIPKITGRFASDSNALTSSILGIKLWTFRWQSIIEAWDPREEIVHCQHWCYLGHSNKIVCFWSAMNLLLMQACGYYYYYYNIVNNTW